MNRAKDVAQLCGVSISTVSRVLAGKTCVKESTRKRILEAVEKTGYRPNIMAQNLKLGKNSVIAIIIPSIDNLIYPPLVRGIEDVVNEQNYIVTVCNTDEDEEKETHFINRFLNRGLAGLIVATLRKKSTQIKKFKDKNFPIVLTNRAYDKSFDTVVVDNHQAAYKMINVLISGGCKHIAYASADPDLFLYEQRFCGYKDALQDAHIPFKKEYVMEDNGDPNSLYGKTKDLLKNHPEIDAVAASNDFRAFVISQAVTDMGFRIPQDISVTGFDGIEVGKYMTPSLTTVYQPLREMGACAANRLLEQINHKEQTGSFLPPETIVLPTEIILRQSTR
ncbi:LacI family DNA-binding transcriptional regulator [Treponema parvum]|uniref:LacI family DNA-binding transcriptional regulator n=1 Tax=Treponema parvum TaxID=138851 RepID=A0A975F1B6_9SPIR|nr:LacI family DNA-binding transcriptional regulator [Treponema parvum]QTQ12558.1 LacI family DNA-binding transcriptional regulator [Treponema parvum]